MQTQTANLLQLQWNNPQAIQSVDILMTILHAGSPSFLIKETKNQGKDGTLGGFAMWLSPTLSLCKESSFIPNLLKRIEVHGETGDTAETANPCVYFTFDPSYWVDEGKVAKHLEQLQREMFLNLIINWVDREVTVVSSSVTETLALSALLQDFFLDKITVQQISSVWDKLSPHITMENKNLTSLCRHYGQKFLKRDKLLKYIPLSYQFFERLVHLPLPKTRNVNLFSKIDTLI